MSQYACASILAASRCGLLIRLHAPLLGALPLPLPVAVEDLVDAVLGLLAALRQPQVHVRDARVLLHALLQLLPAVLQAMVLVVVLVMVLVTGLILVLVMLVAMAKQTK